MLSKKMTFSLMSLITLLAFAFVVPSAVAQKEFKVTVEGRTAVSQADSLKKTVITLKVTTDQPVADPMPTYQTFGTDGLEILAIWCGYCGRHRICSHENSEGASIHSHFA